MFSEIYQSLISSNFESGGNTQNRKQDAFALTD